MALLDPCLPHTVRADAHRLEAVPDSQASFAMALLPSANTYSVGTACWMPGWARHLVLHLVCGVGIDRMPQLLSLEHDLQHHPVAVIGTSENCELGRLVCTGGN